MQRLTETFTEMMNVSIILFGSAEKFIGWPSYSHGILLVIYFFGLSITIVW